MFVQRSQSKLNIPLNSKFIKLNKQFMRRFLFHLLIKIRLPTAEGIRFSVHGNQIHLRKKIFKNHIFFAGKIGKQRAEAQKGKEP